MKAVAGEIGISVATVQRDLRSLGIEPRPQSVPGQGTSDAVAARRQREAHLYEHDELTMEEVGKRVGVSASTVLQDLRSLGIKIRPRNEAISEGLRRYRQTEQGQERTAKQRDEMPRTACRVQCVCECCGVSFERYESQILAGGGRFCSTDCTWAWLWHGPDAPARRGMETFHAGVRAKIHAEGLTPTNSAAEFMKYSPASLRKGRATLQRREFGKMVRLGVNAREVLAASPDPHARGKLAVPLAALNQTERVGRPSGVTRLSHAEIALAADLRSTDPAVWSWRKLASMLTERRDPGQKPISHMAVQRSVKRAAAAL